MLRNRSFVQSVWGAPTSSPRTSLCRIGPRRQGYASPLRALDGSGPIRGATAVQRGKRGGRSAAWEPRQRLNSALGCGYPGGFALGFVADPLARRANTTPAPGNSPQVFCFQCFTYKEGFGFPFCGGRQPSASGGFSFVFSELSTGSSLLLLVLYYLFFTTCMGLHFDRILQGGGLHFATYFGRPGGGVSL